MVGRCFKGVYRLAVLGGEDGVEVVGMGQLESEDWNRDGVGVGGQIGRAHV